MSAAVNAAVSATVSAAVSAAAVVSAAASASVRPRLRDGSRLAVVSPASAAKTELVHAGMAQMKAFGYEPVLMPHALARGPLYYAGTAAERVADLHAAFADASVDGIVCTRGGWGSAELLPLLDCELVRAHPKAFIGYSDHTSLQTAMWQMYGLPSFYAPMVAADWAHAGGVDVRSWRAALHDREPFSFTEDDGLRVLRPGKAQGRMRGGCLALIEAGLGTPWALRVEEPSILFLEDIGVKPYQWDRMLQHLRFAGVLDGVEGIVFGDMRANGEAWEMEGMEAACLHALLDFPGPIALGLKCGHVSGGNQSLVLGVGGELVCEAKAVLTVGVEA